MNSPLNDSGELATAAHAALESLFTKLAVDATQFDFYHALRHVDAAVPGAMPLGRAARPQNRVIGIAHPQPRHIGNRIPRPNPHFIFSQISHGGPGV